MSAPGLKPTVKLESGPTGSRLVDSVSGRSLALSDTEAMLLEFWDGTADVAALVKAAGAASLALDAPQVAVFMTRLTKAGFLAAPLSGEVPKAQGLDTPSATVPKVRLDLQVSKVPEAQGIFLVRDPVGGRTFSLFDFELSVARMLDGKRTAQDVIDGANKIGIAVKLESLRDFVTSLRAYHFVDESGTAAPAAEVGTWPKRKSWDPKVRELFQAALKASREGRKADALSVLDELLRLDADNAEAKELKARQSAAGATPDVGLGFMELHGDLVAAPARTNTDEKLTTLAAFVDPMALSEVSSARPIDLDLNDPALTPKPSAPLPEDVALVGPRVANRRIYRMAGLVGGAILVGVLVTPVSWKQGTVGDLVPRDLGAAVAPWDGTVKELLVKDGAQVKPGDAVLQLDRGPLEAQRAALEQELEPVAAHVKQMLSEPCDPKVRAASTSKLKVAAQLFAPWKAREEKANAAPEADRAKALKALEPGLTTAKAGWARAEAAFEEMTQDQALVDAQTEQKRLEDAIAAIDQQLEASRVKAPSAGYFLSTPGLVGKSVKKGEPLGHLVARTATIVVKGPFPANPPLPEAKLVMDFLNPPVAEEHWVDGPSGKRLEGSVEVRDASQFAKPQPVELNYGERLYVQDLIGR